MSAHHQSFVTEEVSLFAALLPFAWLFAMLAGGKFFDRVRRLRKPPLVRPLSL